MQNHNQPLTPQQQDLVQEQMDLYMHGIEEIIPHEELERKVAASVRDHRPLKIKLGLDPSAPDVHVGHTVVLNKLKQFQDFGHVVQLLIGDFTGKIGDPTGKSVARKPLTTEQVAANAQTYFEQFGQVIRMDQVELHYNSKWLAKLSFEEVIQLAGKITTARLMERDDFEERTALGHPIALHEFFYPVMQGYDSVVLESDIELGGTDQYFNILMGRHFQERLGKDKQVAITMPLLEGLDGTKKMSKSQNNYIGIYEEPASMYGKTMSLPDELIVKYFHLVTSLPKTEIDDIETGLREGTLHPKEAKMQLARTIVTMYHDQQQAGEAEEQFVSVFQQGNVPEQMPTMTLQEGESYNIVDLLATLRLLSSKTEARKMIQNRGVKVNGTRMDDLSASFTIDTDLVIQVGKRKFVKVVPA